MRTSASPPDAPEAMRRVRLAAWITDPRNPTFARAIVNRIWQGHFGTGIVDTPNDFGRQGGRPSHPDLLDWLAAELVRGEFRTKAIHRAIVTSATYRQSSSFDPDAARIDGDNRLLWRANPRRLEAEAVRDTILAVAGRLDRAVGGPSYRDFEVQKRGGTFYYLPVEPAPDTLERRTLYRTWARGGRNGLLDTFDCPDPSTTTPSRANTTTPLQALALLNDAFVLTNVDAFAARLRREAGSDVDAQIARAFALAYQRTPTTEEASICRQTVARHGLEVLARAVLNTNEFLYVD